MNKPIDTQTSLRLDVIALGNYRHTFASDATTEDLPDLKEQLKQLCSQRYRRIDRFIQLCLVGAGRCKKQLSQNTQLPADTGLYLASGLAAMSNTVKVQEHIFQHQLPPKPAHFINTLSNSAGFYVAKDLGLTGKNIFVSRASASFEAALQLVSQDLCISEIKLALVGAVDECLMPVNEHKSRLRLENSQTLAEGSHWLLLKRQADGCRREPDDRSQEAVSDTTSDTLPADIFSGTPPLGYIEQPKTVNTAVGLHEWLNKVLPADNIPDTAIYYHGTQTLAAKYDAACIPALPLFNESFNESNARQPGYYDTRSAGVICDFLKNGTSKHLLSFNADKAGRLHVLKVTRYNKVK